MLFFDEIEILEKALAKRGYRKSAKIGKSGGRLHTPIGKERICTIGKLPHKSVRGVRGVPGLRPGETIVPDFDAIIRDLERLNREGNTPCDLVFQGGGTVPLPPELLEAARRLGFTIYVLSNGTSGENDWSRDDWGVRVVTLEEYLSRLPSGTTLEREDLDYRRR